MSEFTTKESLKSFGVKHILNFLDKDPEKNVPKILDALERFDSKGIISSQLETVRQVLSDQNSNWYQLVKKLYNELDTEVRKKMFENFIINTVIIGLVRQEKTKEENGCNVPWAILLDPTSACNLHCKGCWAAEYGNKMNLTLEEWDSIITQGKEMGTFMYIYSGGEPTVRKDDIFHICEMHSDCMFLAFTNATLIDEEFADKMMHVKNFIPAISVEGFGDATDFRRGQGTYEKILRAMNILKKSHLPFGISCCYTSKNAEVIGSEEYIDDMVAKGALFAWFFTYMPVGKDAVTELMATAEQRKYMYHQIREFRNTKPLFTMDFWNDGEYVDGCIAGGRCYCHINANGDIEPCAFIHYSDSNIREKTLLEAYKSPLFMAYHDNQPFNSNMLRPCPLLDNPGRLTQMVEQSGAQSTDMESPEDVHTLAERCIASAKQWAPVADELWINSLDGQKTACAGCYANCKYQYK
ncbi:MAG: Radical domain protein [Bacillota bacterium]|nr:Radical domain protein [Bacillota bacterium]